MELIFRDNTEETQSVCLKIKKQPKKAFIM